MKRILGLLIYLMGASGISAMEVDFFAANAQLGGEALIDTLYQVNGLMNVGFVELLLDARGITPYQTLLSQDFATKNVNLVANLTHVAQVPADLGVVVVPGGQGFAGAGGFLPRPVAMPLAERGFGYGFPWGLELEDYPDIGTQFSLYLAGKGLADLIFTPEFQNIEGVSSIVYYMLMNVAVLDELIWLKQGSYNSAIDNPFESSHFGQRADDLDLVLTFLQDSFSMAELAEIVSAVVGSTIPRRQPARQELEAIIGEKLPEIPVVDAVPVVAQRPGMPQLSPAEIEALRGGFVHVPEERVAPIPHELNPRQEMLAQLNFEKGGARPALRHVDVPERPLLGEPAKEASAEAKALQKRDINDLVGARQEVAATTNAQKIINLLSDEEADYYSVDLELDGRQETALRAVEDDLLAPYLADMGEAIERDDFDTSDDIKAIKSRLIREQLQGQSAAARPVAQPVLGLGKGDDEDGAAPAVVQPRPVPVPAWQAPAPVARVDNPLAWGYVAPKGSGLSEELDAKIDEIAAISGLNGVQKANLIRIVKAVTADERVEFLDELKDRSERFSLDGDQVIDLAEFLGLIRRGEVTPYTTGQAYKPAIELANGLHRAKITALLDRNITKVVGNQALGESADVTKWRQFFAGPK